MNIIIIELTQLGNLGWEAVGLTSGGTVLLKRELQ